MIERGNSRRLGVFLAIAALLSMLPRGGESLAQAPKATLRGGFNDSPPLAYLDEDGKPAGIVIDLAARLFQRAGVGLQPNVYPAARLFRGLEEGDIDFSILVHAPSLDTCCLISAAPVMEHVLRAYFLAGRQPVDSLEELKGRSLIVLRGYSYGGLIERFASEASQNRIEVANDIISAVQMLDRGRADYLLAYEVNANEVIDKRGGGEIRSALLKRVPIFLVVSRRAPMAAQLMSDLEKEAPSLRAKDWP